MRGFQRLKDSQTGKWNTVIHYQDACALWYIQALKAQGFKVQPLKEQRENSSHISARLERVYALVELRHPYTPEEQNELGWAAKKRAWTSTHLVHSAKAWRCVLEHLKNTSFPTQVCLQMSGRVAFEDSVAETKQSGLEGIYEPFLNTTRFPSNKNRKNGLIARNRLAQEFLEDPYDQVLAQCLGGIGHHGGSRHRIHLKGCRDYIKKELL